MKMLEALEKHGKTLRSEFEEATTIEHGGERGRRREKSVADYIRKFLPEGYGIGDGEIFSADGKVSRQEDIILYDKIWSVAITVPNGPLLVPCESVYGVIEVKSTLNTRELKDAVAKIASLKCMKREEATVADFTPLARMTVGNGLEANLVKRNEYFGIVLALDGMGKERVAAELIKIYGEERNERLMPDYIFNVGRGYGITKYMALDDNKQFIIDIQGCPSIGLLPVDLHERVLPIFCLTLIAKLQHMRLRRAESIDLWINGWRGSGEKLLGHRWEPGSEGL